VNLAVNFRGLLNFSIPELQKMQLAALPVQLLTQQQDLA
jgi:hypothetical protein